MQVEHWGKRNSQALSSWLSLVIGCNARFKNSHLGCRLEFANPLIMLFTGGFVSSCVWAASYPLTAWRRRSDGKAVRTSTVCCKMRRRAHSTRSSPPLAMKAGIHSTLPLRLRRRCRKRSFHSSLTRSWKALWTTDGFMVTKLVRCPTSRKYSSTGARLHLKTSVAQFQCKNEKNSVQSHTKVDHLE